MSMHYIPGTEVLQVRGPGDEIFSAAGTYFEDLHVFNTTNMRWQELTSKVVGPRPAARAFHGYTAEGGYLYVHGGSNSGSNSGAPCCSNTAT